MRVQRALANLAVFPCQQSNGDLELFAETRAGSFSKGLQHDPVTGIVNATAFQLFLDAIASHNFDNVPMGGERKFTSPQSGQMFELSGGDTQVRWGKYVCLISSSIVSVVCDTAGAQVFQRGNGGRDGGAVLGRSSARRSV
jgi:hypothetical protein